MASHQLKATTNSILNAVADLAELRAPRKVVMTQYDAMDDMEYVLHLLSCSNHNSHCRLAYLYVCHRIDQKVRFEKDLLTTLQA